jgi:hypothetical protein
MLWFSLRFTFYSSLRFNCLLGAKVPLPHFPISPFPHFPISPFPHFPISLFRPFPLSLISRFPLSSSMVSAMLAPDRHRRNLYAS